MRSILRHFFTLALLLSFGACDFQHQHEHNLSDTLQNALDLVGRGVNSSGRALDELSDDFHNTVSKELDKHGSDYDFQPTQANYVEAFSVVMLENQSSGEFVLQVEGQEQFLVFDLASLVLETSTGSFRLVEDLSGNGEFNWLFEDQGDFIQVKLQGRQNGNLEGVLTVYFQ